jgi:RNA polymerase sigma-70 factor (ECF subfamily)
VANKLSQNTDASLITLFKKTGENSYLGELLERYSLLVYGVCMKYLKDQTSAQDATQQVFEKVIKEVTKYEIPYFKSWLYSVAKNQCLMQLRTSSNKIKYSDKDIHELEINADDDSGLKLREYMLQEKLEILKDSIQKLNKDQSACIDLFYLQKLSYREIEQNTGFTFQQIKSNIQNGKRNLRMMLESKMQKDEN